MQVFISGSYIHPFQRLYKNSIFADCLPLLVKVPRALQHADQEKCSRPSCPRPGRLGACARRYKNKKP